MRLHRAQLLGIGCIILSQQLCSAKIAPLSVQPSQNWLVTLFHAPQRAHFNLPRFCVLRDGNDGNWSTFTIGVGTPEQSVRVVPFTASQALWVMLPRACPPSVSPPDCTITRGGTFYPNLSTTWDGDNNYELGVALNLNYSHSETGDYGHYGYDSLSFQWPGSSGPTIDHQVIAAIDNRSQWYLGGLGLDPRSINFTTYLNPKPSMLSALRNMSFIPSLSYGYTAGAPYRGKGVHGSLTLGGYDESRFVHNAVQFDFASLDDRDLVVAIRDVNLYTTTRGTHSALDKIVLANIDSSVPHIWLPLHVCEAFEAAFGLSWDPITQLYLVNDTLHEALSSDAASVTFELDSTSKEGGTTVIRLPYASFALSVSWPIVQNKTRYFPLKRAANDTQVTLGRTFLQEAYLTVDHERRKFSVSQAAFNETAAQQLVAIKPLHGLTSGPGLASGAIVGLVVGVILLVGFALFVVGMSHLRNKRQNRRAKEKSMQELPNFEAKLQRDGEVAEIDGEQLLAEAHGNPIHEAHEDRVIHELPGRDFSSRHNGDR